MTIEEARELKALTDAIVENLCIIRDAVTLNFPSRDGHTAWSLAASRSRQEASQETARKDSSADSPDVPPMCPPDSSIGWSERLPPIMARTGGATLKRGAATQVMTYPSPVSKSIIVEASRRTKLSLSSFMIMASLKEANRMKLTPGDVPQQLVDSGLSGYFTEAELAAELGTTERTLRRWNARRTGPPRTEIGKAIYYKKSSVSDWLRQCEERTTCSGNGNPGDEGAFTIACSDFPEENPDTHAEGVGDPRDHIDGR